MLIYNERNWSRFFLNVMLLFNISADKYKHSYGYLDPEMLKIGLRQDARNN